MNYATRIFLLTFCFIDELKALDIKASNAEALRGFNVEPAESGAYSFVASIGIRDDQFDDDVTHFCTGTLISKKHILTAAHCFKGHLLGEIRVVLGSVDMRNGTKYYPSSWITYDQWAEEKGIRKEFEANDIAIITLSEKVDEKVAKPVLLSCTNPSKLRNKIVTLAGWGFTNDDSEPSRYLQKSTVRVLSNEKCENITFVMEKARIPVRKGYFCTRTVPFNLVACGDSGGPVLTAKNDLLAVSKGLCPKPKLQYPQNFIDDNQVNVHVSVRYYKQFIKDVLKRY